MKKLLLGFFILMLSSSAIYANELTEDYFDIAVNYCIEGNYNEAYAYINKILAIEPNNNDAKNLKNTITRINDAKNLSYISNHSNQVKIATDYKNLGNKDKELETLNNALKSNSNNYWASYMLAEFYRKNNDKNNAITYYKKTLNLKPSFSQCYMDIALIYFTNKEYKSALENINKYIDINPDTDVAYALRAKINLNTNNINEAKKDIQKARQINDDISYKLIEAKITFAEHNYSLARQQFESLSKDIKTSEIYKYLGLCDYELGNWTSALLNLDKAIILSDDDKTLDLKYNEIKNKLEKK